MEPDVFAGGGFCVKSFRTHPKTSSKGAAFDASQIIDKPWEKKEGAQALLLLIDFQ